MGLKTCTLVFENLSAVDLQKKFDGMEADGWMVYDVHSYVASLSLLVVIVVFGMRV